VGGKGKGISLQAWEGFWRSRRLRLLDLLDTRHFEGGKVVTPTHRLSLPPGVFLVLIFRGWVDPRAHVSVGTSENTTRDQSRDPPTSSALPYPLRYPRPRTWVVGMTILEASPFLPDDVFFSSPLWVLSASGERLSLKLSLLKHRAILLEVKL
jgi:hypothetical protein